MKMPVIVLLIVFAVVNPVRSAVIKGKVTVSAKKSVPLKSNYSRGVFEPKIKGTNGTAAADADSGKMKVVVWAEPADAEVKYVAPGEKPLINQQNKMFVPDLLVIQAGTTVGFPNLDPLYHNVFSYSKAKRFDIGRYKQGNSKDVLFDNEGVVEVFCEIHENMLAYIVVVNTPYFTTVDENGEFSINVPSGKYDVKAWSPSSEEEITKVDLKDDEEIVVNFSF
ncbi:carboxypeptidase regulatory-like domain-containing protein [Candidatus Latescibacterota bacterium]